MNLDIKFTDISIMLKLRLVFMELAFMVLSLGVALIPKKSKIQNLMPNMKTEFLFILCTSLQTGKRIVKGLETE